MLLAKHRKIGKEVAYGVVIALIVSVITAFITGVFERDEPVADSRYEALEQAEFVTEEQKKLWIVRNEFYIALRLITPAKMLMMDYYYDKGEFAKNDRQLDVSVLDLKEHEQIKRVTVVERGFVAYLSDAMGDHVFLLLEPKLSTNGAHVKWNCLTNLEKKYIELAGSTECEFIKSLN